MSPGRQSAGTELTDGLLEELDGALDQVASLDEDRILRSFLTVIKATLRTNFFQQTENGEPHSYVSMKFDPQAIPDLPAPRPAYEIWVYSPRVEGVHLRFGKVARGGLRWSDRREDFRTEILGLVKAQMVKNTVIVPVGAKGGFVAKQLPDPSVDRDAWFAEGIAAYRTFISALLDITDNMVAGEVVPPTDVVRHDEDDTYLVVAADKGTASFSDIANEVAVAYNFWLGDAFASGGSAGDDHKGMGITARGAWESVKRHFRELGHDTQTEDFTVVGVGDMSGDVFGNGMLLSEHIRLVAAFDHRHIFIDPNPDAATSYAERRRLFDLPRSSWADYNTDLLSAGGGIHSRSAKAIPLNAHIREALGIDASVTKMTPADLMQTILKSPVDLVWNGGIGTYIKAVSESNADVGDKANDAIRVNGEDLRAKVVGEGGNLGATQLGRIEFARNGGRINTDAIDNSAGVDTSDHEVNIKILLNGLVRDGDMTVKQRNKLLADMTDEVGALVLRNNYTQNVALSDASAQAPSPLDAQQRFMRLLERDGALDRALEFLPADRHIRELLGNEKGLSQPELAVLLAYTKITTVDELISTVLPDDPHLQKLVHAYFPSALRERFPEVVYAHALRREIITTVLVNDTVNTAGSTFLHRLREETGASIEEIVRYEFHRPGDLRSLSGVGRGRGARQQGRRRRPDPDPAALAAAGRTRFALAARPPQPGCHRGDHRRFPGRVRAGLERPAQAGPGADLDWYHSILDELTAAGVPDELAVRVAGFSSPSRAGHRGHRRPDGQGAAGGRGGLLRPRGPAADHAADGPDHRAASGRPLAVHGPRLHPRGPVRGARGAHVGRAERGERVLDAGGAVPGVGGEERGRSWPGRARRWRRSRGRTDGGGDLSVAMRTMRTLLRTHA
ncbi:NAD-glutamate dehydrogenase [Streptomyces badius]